MGHDKEPTRIIVDSWKSDTYPIILYKRQIIMKDRSIDRRKSSCLSPPLVTNRPPPTDMTVSRRLNKQGHFDDNGSSFGIDLSLVLTD